MDNRLAHACILMLSLILLSEGKTRPEVARFIAQTTLDVLESNV